MRDYGATMTVHAPTVRRGDDKDPWWTAQCHECGWWFTSRSGVDARAAARRHEKAVA